MPAYAWPLAEVRLAGITANVLAVDIGKVGTAEQRRIVSVLTRLGFAPGKKDRNGRLIFERNNVRPSRRKPPSLAGNGNAVRNHGYSLRLGGRNEATSFQVP